MHYAARSVHKQTCTAHPCHSPSIQCAESRTNKIAITDTIYLHLILRVGCYYYIACGVLDLFWLSTANSYCHFNFLLFLGLICWIRRAYAVRTVWVFDCDLFEKKNLFYITDLSSLQNKWHCECHRARFFLSKQARVAPYTCRTSSIIWKCWITQIAFWIGCVLGVHTASCKIGSTKRTAHSWNHYKCIWYDNKLTWMITKMPQSSAFNAYSIEFYLEAERYGAVHRNGDNEWFFPWWWNDFRLQLFGWEHFNTNKV